MGSGSKALTNYRLPTGQPAAEKLARDARRYRIRSARRVVGVISSISSRSSDWCSRAVEPFEPKGPTDARMAHPKDRWTPLQIPRRGAAGEVETRTKLALDKAAVRTASPALHKAKVIAPAIVRSPNRLPRSLPTSLRLPPAIEHRDQAIIRAPAPATPGPARTRPRHQAWSQRKTKPLAAGIGEPRPPQATRPR